MSVLSGCYQCRFDLGTDGIQVEGDRDVVEAVAAAVAAAAAAAAVAQAEFLWDLMTASEVVVLMLVVQCLR